VQRITDGFEDFKFSHIAGLYPLHVDASGCQYEPPPPPPPRQQFADTSSNDQRARTGNGNPRNNAQSNNRQSHGDQQAQNDRTGVAHPQEINGQTPGNRRQEDRPSHLNKRQQIDTHPRPQEDSHLEDSGRAQMSNAMRESLSDAGSQPVGQQYSLPEQVQAVPKCVPQGLIPSGCSILFRRLSDCRAHNARVFVWWGSRLDVRILPQGTSVARWSHRSVQESVRSKC